jgi:hypothetical protein
MKLTKKCSFALLIVLPLIASSWKSFSADQMPALGRDAVLVWKIQNQKFDSEFVIRIAEFLPDRFMEWEDYQTQGTVFMPSREIEEAQGYVNSQLFVSGIDARAKNVTTLWLSRKIYRNLKAQSKIKINLDEVPGWITLVGSDQFTMEVNKSKITLPVIKVKDDRGAERWFLDQEENPLVVKYMVRQYCEILTSITTDRTHTLRFIKGSKLEHLPH